MQLVHMRTVCGFPQTSQSVLEKAAAAEAAAAAVAAEEEAASGGGGSGGEGARRSRGAGGLVEEIEEVSAADGEGLRDAFWPMLFFVMIEGRSDERNDH